MTIDKQETIVKGLSWITADPCERRTWCDTGLSHVALVLDTQRFRPVGEEEKDSFLTRLLKRRETKRPPES